MPGLRRSMWGSRTFVIVTPLDHPPIWCTAVRPAGTRISAGAPSNPISQASQLAWYTAARWSGGRLGSEGSLKMRPFTCCMR